MSFLKIPQTKEIAVIGAGVIGNCTAWHLGELGHEINLIEPKAQESQNRDFPNNGTSASLGILMGNVFRRTKGRAWNLRKESMATWPKWIRKLQAVEGDLTINTPLIQIASSIEEEKKIADFVRSQSSRGLEILSIDQIKNLQPSLEYVKFNGLISYNDGWLNPIKLQKSLIKAQRQFAVNQINDHVVKLERCQKKSNGRWTIYLEKNEKLTVNTVVICAGMNSEGLIKDLGYRFNTTPVVGQAIEVKIDNVSWENWPAVLVKEGINLIPIDTNKIILGATLEPGLKHSQQCLREIFSLKGCAPKWLLEGEICKKWYGIRARPANQPAPILEKPEPGLILATGLYRNGILLAPATTKWIASQIEVDE